MWTLSPALLVWMIRAWRPRRQRLAHHPRFQRLPFRIVLRAPVLAAVVIEIAAGLFRERMHQQPALHAARHDHPPHDVEVLARLLVGPRRAPGASGCRRSGVPEPWHAMHRAWPGRSARKIGWTLVLKNS